LYVGGSHRFTVFGVGRSSSSLMISGGSPGICTVHSRSTIGVANAAKAVEVIDQVHMLSIPPEIHAISPSFM
jgi:hypothetical protein